jgi:putative transposase
VFVTLRGEPYLLWRAVDQHGIELDILLQKRRDRAAAKRFFKRVLASCPEAPRKIVTDHLRSYPAAKAEILELANVKHVFVKASARLNNRAENSHQPTRERERRIPQGDFLRGVRGFRDTNVRRHSCRASVDPTALRAQATFAVRLALSKTARGALRRVASLHFTSLSSPEIRPLSEQGCVLTDIASLTIQRDSADRIALIRARVPR